VDIYGYRPWYERALIGVGFAVLLVAAIIGLSMLADLAGLGPVGTTGP
jgi:hypothetical protein